MLPTLEKNLFFQYVAQLCPNLSEINVQVFFQAKRENFYQPRSGMVMGWVVMLFLFWFFWGHLAFDLTY